MLDLLIFVASSGLVVLAAIQMAKYGDVIAIKTGLGRLFIGTVLLAAATSLPELLTNIVAVRQGLPNLAAGNLMGSSIFNMAIIAILDIANQQARLLRRIAVTHALTASLGIVMLGLVALFILVRFDAGVLWLGFDSLSLVGVFIAGIYVIRRQGRVSGASMAPEPTETPTSLLKAGILFALSTALLWLASPHLVSSSNSLAVSTGVGASFFGTSALAIVTSLPELISSLVAVRMGAYDLAIGNLFGSNMFNIMTLGVVDAFYTDGFFLSAIDPVFALAAIIALLLMALALIGNLVRAERRLIFVEVDALLILVGYFAGMYLLYARGMVTG
jgi:cation:H+ antiporter